MLQRKRVRLAALGQPFRICFIFLAALDAPLRIIRQKFVAGVLNPLGGERKEVTVLFSDIRGFTAFSEQVEPEVVIEMLNTYLRHQARLVNEYDGDIDKYVGDQLVAVFQGEGMVARAMKCAALCWWTPTPICSYMATPSARSSN